MRMQPMNNEELAKAIDYTITRIGGCGENEQLKAIMTDHLENLLDVQSSRVYGVKNENF